MGIFDSAQIVKINNKEVKSIKTANGATIYQKPTAILADYYIVLGLPDTQWLNTTGNVVINWGDGSASIVNNPTQRLTHNYTDGKNNYGIVFLGTVTGFGNYCFRDCVGLKSITIPNTVTSLGEFCFDTCRDLTSVVIPNSVTNIGQYCFRLCNALIDYQLYWTNNNIITYDSSKMPNNTNTKFYVPKGQKTNYVNKGYPSDKVVERSS